MPSLISVLLLAAIGPRWVPSFAQEFDGPAGQPPDPKVWVRDLGGSGWGNGEWQSYTDGSANAFLDGKGHLVIEARKEPTKGPDGIARDYSSARMHTRGKFSQKYGRIEARIKLPHGKGIWPAFWTMGDTTEKVGWPAGGELDIMEFLGHDPKTVYGTLHGPGYSGSGGVQAKYSSPVDLSSGFRTYGVEWDPHKISWTFDGKVYATKTPDDITYRAWVFDAPFYLILNLAVGGAWPGYPDSSTSFPQRMVVDYVRAYRDANLKVDKAEIARRHRARLQKYQEFKSAPVFSIPGTITAVDFRKDGYRDADSTNQGGGYRPLEGVDIGGSGMETPKYSIGWTRAGEWLSYDVDVHRAGTYTISVEVASAGPGGTIRLDLKGKPLTNSVKVPDTGGWQAWREVSLGSVPIPAGKHELRLRMLSNGPSGSVANVVRIRVVADS